MSSRRFRVDDDNIASSFVEFPLAHDDVVIVFDILDNFILKLDNLVDMIVDEPNILILSGQVFQAVVEFFDVIFKLIDKFGVYAFILMVVG